MLILITMILRDDFSGSYSKPCGRPRAKLAEEHSKFLVDYVKQNTTVILDELKLKLCEKFEGLKISYFWHSQTFST